MKHVATAKITDPTAVASRCTALGWNNPHKGAIFCEVPELGYLGVNLIYCRYGLSIPYIRVQEGWKLLVEPTIGTSERWFYVGLADCTGGITPDSQMQLLIKLLSQVIYASTAGTMHLSNQTAAEAFVLGTTALVELTKHQNLITQLQTALNTWVPSNPVETDAAALKVALATFLSLPTPDYSKILSKKIYGE